MSQSDIIFLIGGMLLPNNLTPKIVRYCGKHLRRYMKAIKIASAL